MSWILILVICPVVCFIILMLDCVATGQLLLSDLVAALVVSLVPLVNLVAVAMTIFHYIDLRWPEDKVLWSRKPKV
jgi:hypothetical protein